MEASIFKDNWQELKKNVHEEWDKLTEEDIETIDGDLESLKAKISEVYGYGKSKMNQELKNFLSFLEKSETTGKKSNGIVWGYLQNPLLQAAFFVAAGWLVRRMFKR